MQRSIRLSLSLGGAAALGLSSTSFLPAAAQDADTAEDLGGVMSISLQDVVKAHHWLPADRTECSSRLRRLELQHPSTSCFRWLLLPTP